MNTHGRGISANAPSARSRGRRRRNRGYRYRGQQDVASAAPDSDEIFYDERRVYDMTSVNDFTQNFDYAGFLVLVEETYDFLLDKGFNIMMSLPFSVFQHVMVNHLNIQILKIAWKNFHNLDNLNPTLPHLALGSCLPKPIFDYLTHVSDTVTESGIEVKLNLPKIAIPQGPIGDIPSGTFGVINAHTHNVYECYISPLVTANRVIASLNDTPDYQPLPPAVISSDLIPNENLLGYGPIDTLLNDTRKELLGIIDFHDNDSIVGRLKICLPLIHYVQGIMSMMQNKIKIVMNCGEIIPRSVLSNLCFVESCGTRRSSLSRMDVRVHSYDKFSSMTANQTNLESMHRHRVDNAVGSCYTAADGSVPAGWEATCNSNFQMDGVFAPNISYLKDCPELRLKRFVSYATAATRKDVYQNFISYNYLI